MNTSINVPDYSPERGIELQWDEGFEITAQIDGNVVQIKANRAGLVSLARHLLTLAQAEVPAGRHIHLDELNALEDGSCGLIFERS